MPKAFSHASSLTKLTNPNPRDRPEYLSMMTLASETCSCPTASWKARMRDWSVVDHERFPTKRRYWPPWDCGAPCILSAMFDILVFWIFVWFLNSLVFLLVEMVLDFAVTSHDTGNRATKQQDNEQLEQPRNRLFLTSCL
eukprot:CAMPEP_0184696608 /NCGR_PEP_ID=MMETSP0313-20130426/3839_1 /TAXON_ID=2792 /ORGANISM="Porphyridium aerugineum, Strain SAG 1380-2" /LENGTH=139 /DNA_ID=CAMNT_0027155265 /DNA_START=487 /DNA_END=906 /DNA_ORIENTATION=-